MWFQKFKKMAFQKEVTMKFYLGIALILVIFIQTAFSQTIKANNSPSYHIASILPISGKGGWDYLTFDNETRLLYITRKDPGVTIVNVDTQKIVGIIEKTAGAGCVALAPELNRGFTSNGSRNTVTIFDLATLKPINEVAVGTGPDCITYDSFTKRLFVMNGRSSNATVIDAASGKVVGTIELAAKKLEFAVSDNKGILYVNLQDQNEVVSIDTKDLKIKNHWPVGHGDKPTALAIDREKQRLFIGCRNSMMVIMDSTNGKILAELPIGHGVDAVAYDSTRMLAFNANSDGTINIIQATANDHYSVAATVKTQPGARTLALDSKTHNLYTVTAKMGNPEKPGGRPAFLPDSFVMITVSP